MSAGKRLGGWHGWCSPCAGERPLELTEHGPRGAGAWLAGAATASRELRLTCSTCGGWQHVPRNEADDVDGGLPALPPVLPPVRPPARAAAASRPVAPAVASYAVPHGERSVEPPPVPASGPVLQPVAADHVARTQQRGGAAVSRRGWLQVAPAAIAMFFVSLLVMRTSTAAFSGVTSNGTNNWTAGTVRLSDDDANGAMFNASGMRPGDTGSKCIEVTYEGSVAATAVRLYNTNYSETDGSTDGAVLDDSLNVRVDWDSATTGTFAGGCGDFAVEGTSFNGTLTAMNTAHTDWTTGARAVPPSGDWAPSAAPPTTTRVFRFTWTLASSAPDTVQGDSASVRFTWEARN